jgi:hypothetical protein
MTGWALGSVTMEPVTLLSTMTGCHAVLVLRDAEALRLCGVYTRHCVATIVAADSLGLWVEHPGWGREILPEDRPGRLLIRWSNIEAVLVLSGELSRADLCCLAETSEACPRPIGFRLKAENEGDES